MQFFSNIKMRCYCGFETFDNTQAVMFDVYVLHECDMQMYCPEEKLFAINNGRKVKAHGHMAYYKSTQKNSITIDYTVWVRKHDGPGKKIIQSSIPCYSSSRNPRFVALASLALKDVGRPPS